MPSGLEVSGAKEGDADYNAGANLYLTRSKVMLAFTVVPSLRRRDALSAERQGYSRVATDGVNVPRAKYNHQTTRPTKLVSAPEVRLALPPRHRTKPP